MFINTTCKYLLGAALLTSASSASAQGTAQSTPRPSSLGPNVPAFTVRSGLRVTMASNDLGNARFLEFDNTGKTLFVSQDRRKKIIALQDKDSDGLFETSTDFVAGKDEMHGMHWKDGWLWFGSAGAVNRARDTDGDLKADEVVTVLEGLPRGGHWWRSILVSDDGFFTSIGDSGNINDETATDRQKIWKYSLDGKTRTLWASGLRNTEKLRFRPGTR